MEPNVRILLIEDDQVLANVVRLCLEAEGYHVADAPDGQRGLDLALQGRPDLVMLDILLPRMDGLEVCRELRRRHFEAPILMLTGKNLVEDRVSGLDAGADDYLAKPFDARELLARVHALLRRRGRPRDGMRRITLGDVQIDLDAMSATRAGQSLALTATEFSLLELLARHGGHPVSRETIMRMVWGYRRVPATRTVDTHIWRLRRKLGDSGRQPRFIQRQPGRGYRLVVEGQSTERSEDPPPPGG